MEDRLGPLQPFVTSMTTPIRTCTNNVVDWRLPPLCLVNVLQDAPEPDVWLQLLEECAWAHHERVEMKRRARAWEREYCSDDLSDDSDDVAMDHATELLGSLVVASEGQRKKASADKRALIARQEQQLSALQQQVLDQQHEGAAQRQQLEMQRQQLPALQQEVLSQQQQIAAQQQQIAAQQQQIIVLLQSQLQPQPG